MWPPLHKTTTVLGRSWKATILTKIRGDQPCNQTPKVRHINSRPRFFDPGPTILISKPAFFKRVWPPHNYKLLEAYFLVWDVDPNRYSLTGTYFFWFKNILQTVNHGQVNLQVVTLEVGTNSSIDSEQLKTVLDNHVPTDFVILVLHPQEAHDVFEAVNEQVHLYSLP